MMQQGHASCEVQCKSLQMMLKCTVTEVQFMFLACNVLHTPGPVADGLQLGMLCASTTAKDHIHCDGLHIAWLVGVHTCRRCIVTALRCNNKPVSLARGCRQSHCRFISAVMLTWWRNCVLLTWPPYCLVLLPWDYHYCRPLLPCLCCS